MQDNTQLAAIDIGSNSFRLEIGRFEHEQLQRVEYIKETVRQGSGLDKDRHLSLCSVAGIVWHVFLND
jgi:exopolyphosphatase / guanosine-5'-triphosphate,3'-diphosphate pyrophosphatase